MMADQHPEDLIDRAAQAALDPAEQDVLDRHLATCEGCAALLAQVAGLQRESIRQLRDDSLDQRAVDAAMLRVQPSSPAGRARALPRWFRLAAAGVLLASGVTATAAIVSSKLASRLPVEPPVVRVAEPAAARPAPAPIALPAEVPEVVESPRPSPPLPRAATARPAVTAAELFEQAGKLRREGRADAAIAVYRRLQDTYPAAREAQLSFALAGRLLLKQGRPGDALAQFDRHPRLGGDVGEEALAGRAAALDQLHRTADAIAAWTSLLERYPGSVYAARARARLAELAEHR
jgi:tetratricopeptide (TPR) repeat protein